MSGMPDSSPSSGARKGGGSKNVDGREGGDKWNKQCDASGDGGPGMPQRKASKDPKQVIDANDDVKQLNGGKNRAGKEEGAY